jgi:hypothetical protein
MGLRAIKTGINPDFKKDREARIFRLKPIKTTAQRAFYYSPAGPWFQPGPGIGFTSAFS